MTVISMPVPEYVMGSMDIELSIYFFVGGFPPNSINVLDKELLLQYSAIIQLWHCDTLKHMSWIFLISTSGIHTQSLVWWTFEII